MKNFLFLFIFQIIVLVSLAQSSNTSLTAAQRESFIQRATELRKNEDYNGAVRQLDEVLALNAGDAPLLLFKGDLLLQGRRYADAAATYKQLLPMKFEPTITKINLSYALFMSHRPMQALSFARKAWEENRTNTNAIVNYFNAMLWNTKTADAAKFLKQQGSLLSPAQQLVLKARLHTTNGNYNEGLNYYDSLVSTFPDKYYVQEYAEVLLGKKETVLSASVMKQHDSAFTANEYRAYQLKLKAAKRQNAGTEFVYFRDVANNLRIENSVWWQQGEGRAYRFRLSAGTATYQSAQKEKTTAQFGHLHVHERWSRAWSGESDLHLQLIQPGGGQQFTGLTGQQLIKYQPNDRRMFGASVSTDILNYTASLFGKNIRSNNVGYVTHIMLSGKTGVYSQGSAGWLTDKNRRYQFFGSVYHLFRTEPTLKGGLNVSALHYKDSSIKNYFSPNRYLSTEAFADYSTALPMLSKFYLQLQAAAGLQKIESNSWDPAFRLQAEVGLRLNQMETALKYQTSNVASNTGAGYKFNWFTLRAAWRW